MILIIDFRHEYTCAAAAQRSKALAYETIVIEYTWVQSFSLPSVSSFKIILYPAHFF